MSGLNKAKGGRKNRKWTRNKAFCLQYKNENRREKNKIVNLKRHMEKFPMDIAVLAHIERLKVVISGVNASRTK